MTVALAESLLDVLCANRLLKLIQYTAQMVNVMGFPYL